LNNVGQVIAIGGGGFGIKANIEEYIISQSNTSKPNICFIPTASAEDKAYTVRYYSTFTKFNCNPTHLNFFQRTPRLDSLINKQDIIYVGGGNTKSMLAVWKEWKLDKVLLKAYNRGAILCGVSAGSICWFEKGVTDSWASNLNVIDCLGFVKGNNCPHYNSEKDREPSVHKFLNDKIIDSCYASDDGSALHFSNGELKSAVSFYEKANSYDIFIKDNKVNQKTIKAIEIY